MEPQKAMKLVLLGDSGVGKTSIFTRWTEDQVDANHAPTIGSAVKNLPYEYGDDIWDLQIWDTAGQETYRSTAPIYCRNANGALIVFDLTNKKTFEECDEWLEILRNQCGECEVVLVGNKADLEGDRVVPRERVQEYAKKIDAHYFETSAKLNMYVDEAFVDLISQTIQSIENRPMETIPGVDLSDSTTMTEPMAQNSCCISQYF